MKKSLNSVHETLQIKNSVAIKVRGYDTNVDQKLITVTEDKVHICLDKNLKRIGKKRWIHPLSLLSSLLLALATSEFNKLSWVSADLLKATFIVSAAITTGWLVWEIMQSAQLKHAQDVIHDIFAELRGDHSIQMLDYDFDLETA